MSKSILMLYELLPQQLDELADIASDYKIIHSLEEAKAESTEIILGWSNNLIPLIEDEKSNIKWIQYPYAGVNDLPLDLFQEKGIILTNGSGIHTYAVSESAMALILGRTRNIIASAQNREKEEWKEWVDGNNLYELNGKTIMVVGAGKIGVHLGQIAQGFGMKTIGINRSGREIENMDEQYTQDKLADVLHQADIVVNILPATDETAHLFNAELFDHMKDEAIFINVGRGETVDTDALLDALDNGKLSFAGLDVFEEEPLPKGHPIWTHEKIVMTPHLGGYVENYAKSLYPIFEENLKAFVQNETLPTNVITYETGY